MDSDTIMKKYPHLTAQAMEATGKSDPQEAIETLLADTPSSDPVDTLTSVTPERAMRYGNIPTADAYNLLTQQNKAIIKDLVDYLLETRQNGEGATA